MKKIFVDTNVIIDFLTNRQPFSIDAANIFEISKRGKLKLFVSSLSINNIHYVVSRIESKKKSIKLINQLLPLIEILPVGKSTIEKSLIANFTDFEDGLQNFCAEEGKLDTIVTRNVKDFSKSNLSIQTPSEYLASIQ